MPLVRRSLKTDVHSDHLKKKGLHLKRLICFCLTTLVSFSNAYAASEAVVDELMHKSGLWLQVAQIEQQVQLGMSKGLEKQRETGTIDVEQVRHAVATAYAPDRLRAEVKRQLSSSLTDAETTRVLGWLSSNLGRRLTALEEKSGEVNQFLERQDEASHFLHSISAERLALIRRFTRTIQIGEASASIIINTMAGITYGMSLTSSRVEPCDINDIKRQFASQKQQLIQAFEKDSITQFAYMYKSVSNADLKRYIAFAGTPVGRKYNAASIQALDAALTKAATQLGRELGVPSRSARFNRENMEPSLPLMTTAFMQRVTATPIIY